MTPSDLLQKIAKDAALIPLLSSSLRYQNSRDYVMRGLPIPDRLLPGRMIQNMSEESRKLLRELTSDDAAKCRWPTWADEPKKETPPLRKRSRVYTFK
jgi:hypothetical protein